MVRIVAWKVKYFDTWDFQKPIVSCQAPIQPIPNQIPIIKMFTLGIFGTEKLQIHETTIINNISERLHLVIVPQSSAQFFILLDNLVNILITQLGNILAPFQAS